MPLHTAHSYVARFYYMAMIFGQYAVGAVAIGLDRIWFGALYAIGTLLALEFIVIRFCAHCPYPCNHRTCLMMPSFFPVIHARAKRDTMTTLDRYAFPVLMMVVLPLIPQYWLIRHKGLLVTFWAMYAAGWGAMMMFKCRYCLFRECPLNYAKKDGGIERN